MAFMRGMEILGITLTIFLLTLIELSVEEIGGYFFFLMFSVVAASCASSFSPSLADCKTFRS